MAQILESWPGEPDEDILQLLVDAHAHPTDYKRFSLDKEYRGAAEQLRVSKVSDDDGFAGWSMAALLLALAVATGYGLRVGDLGVRPDMLV